MNSNVKEYSPSDVRDDEEHALVTPSLSHYSNLLATKPIELQFPYDRRGNDIHFKTKTFCS